MHFEPKQCVRALTACVLVTIFSIPQNLFAQAAEHVVSSSEMQKAVVDASRARQQNLETLKEFFSSEKAQRALKAAHTDPAQVNKAVATLSDAELAQLASRAQKVQADFAAGTLSDRDLIVILIAIAALILIIVAVR
jgi:c-di-GMP-related signal transduction protein